MSRLYCLLLTQRPMPTRESTMAMPVSIHIGAHVSIRPHGEGGPTYPG